MRSDTKKMIKVDDDELVGLVHATSFFDICILELEILTQCSIHLGWNSSFQNLKRYNLLSLQQLLY